MSTAHNDGIVQPPVIVLDSNQHNTYDNSNKSEGHNNTHLWTRLHCTTRKHMLNGMVLLIELITLVACIVSFTCELLQYKISYSRLDTYGSSDDRGHYTVYVYWNQLLCTTTDMYYLYPSDAVILDRQVTYTQLFTYEFITDNPTYNTFGTVHIIMYSLTCMFISAALIATLNRVLHYTYTVRTIELTCYTISILCNLCGMCVIIPLFIIIIGMYGYIILYMLYRNKSYQTKFSFHYSTMCGRPCVELVDKQSTIQIKCKLSASIQ